MQEEKLVELLHNLMSDICDHNCKKIDGKTQEESEDICAECQAGDHICKILNENTRYSEIVLCIECKYFLKVKDFHGTEIAWCRKCELDGYVNHKDGCSRGRRRK